MPATSSSAQALEGWLTQLLGAPPRQLALFEAAVTHRSAHAGNYERLEFLGDAVLNLVIAEALYLRHPGTDEGGLSRLRANLVSGVPLAQIGAEIRVGEVLRLGSGELRSGGMRRESILADATEALIGALYLDQGLPAARDFVLRLYASRLEGLQPEDELKDAKTRLQELMQAHGEELPNYQLESTVGEPHAQTFFVRCSVRHGDPARHLEAPGAGPSRRAAEQQAAEAVLRQLEGYPAA